MIRIKLCNIVDFGVTMSGNFSARFRTVGYLLLAGDCPVIGIIRRNSPLIETTL